MMHVLSEKRTNILRLMLAIMLAALLATGVLALAGGPPATANAAASLPVTVNESGVTATGVLGASSYQWASAGSDYDTAEIWYSVDQGTTNTITLRLDVSPDGENWKTNHVAILTDNTSDASLSYTTTTIVGRYARIHATVANTNTVTPTVKLVYSK
jgi:hypothetical protein